jgi:hypothetical protein
MTISLIGTADNADVNLYVGTDIFAGQVTTGPTWCQALIEVGDGTKDPAATAGTWELSIRLNDLVGDPWVVEPYPQLIWAGTGTPKGFMSRPFLVRNGLVVQAKLKSPNAADTDVDVTFFLYDVSAGHALNIPIGTEIAAVAGSLNERIETMDDAYTATRAGYLDELAAANLPTDIDAILADVTADEGHSTKVDYHSTRLG